MLERIRRISTSSAGVTLADFVVAICILSIIATMAALSQRPIVTSYKANAAARQVLTDLRLVRSKALQQNTPFRVNFAANGTTYTVERYVPGSGSPGTWQDWALYIRGASALGTLQPVPLPGGIESQDAYVVRFLPRGGAVTDSTETKVRLRVTGTDVRAGVEVTVAGAVRFTNPT